VKYSLNWLIQKHSTAQVGYEQNKAKTKQAFMLGALEKKEERTNLINYTGGKELFKPPLMLNWRNPRPFLSGPTARTPLFFFLLHYKQRTSCVYK